MQPLGDNTVNVPAFLGKLWKMVNDPETDHLICWNSAGNSFIIQNQAQFWYELLPVYYKHNNMSSFVRQLNMYGFHKVSCVENGTMDTDKDEIVFFHPYFQKDKIELLKNIKRKVTGPKPLDGGSQATAKSDEITKVLMDMKQIRGRQAAVDNQLLAMKQENAVLWRELALLRQKHMKQQQIVNKLIHFLITLVQPTTRMGVGVKRRYPLMLCEKPTKKRKTQKSVVNQKQEKKPQEAPVVHDGPTIHELDAEFDFGPGDLYEEEVDHSPPLINSPETSASSTSSKADSISGSRKSARSVVEELMSDEASQGASVSPEMFWDKPDLIKPGDYIIGDDGEIMKTLEHIQEEENEQMAANDTLQSSTPPDIQKVFLNPNAQDTLLTNLINGTYNINPLNIKSERKAANKKDVTNTKQSSLAVATKDTSNTPPEIDELHNLVGSTQSDLEQLKDMLSTCNSFDANALIGLFNESPEYGLSLNQTNSLNQPNKDNNSSSEANDPLVSGSELTTYGINMVDFNELFDDVDDSKDFSMAISPKDLNLDSTVNTPLVEPADLAFPTDSRS